MKAHKLFKKAVAGVLSLALALGIAPSVMSTGQAYAGTAATPGISVYADKTALTDDTFTPKLNDEKTAVTDENNVGKIKFGGKSWYLLGGDGTYVDVFAAEKLSDNVKFHEGDSEFNPTTDSEPWSSVVYSGSKPTTVYPNNYGASILRATLQDYAKESSGKFNSVERSMMNQIEVTTTDTKNNQTYTTADKLYAAAGEEGQSKINVNGKDLPMGTYWSSDMFWLRSPDSSIYFSGFALIGNGGVNVSSINANRDNVGVRPASNLNLSSVIFASAAPAATSATKGSKTIFNSDVMNLRLEAKDSGTTVTKSQLGDVTVNASVGTITATKGNAGTVTLMVQGNDGTDNWYYAKDLTSGDTTVKASDIGDDVDLSKCKVWLEATGTDGMIYATNPPVEYTITTSVTHGTIDAVATVISGEDLTINYSAYKGYELTAIEIDGDPLSDISGHENSYTFENVADNHSIDVTFSPIEYKITYNLDGGTNAKDNPTTYTIEDETIGLAQPTKTGYVFEGWTCDDVDEPTKGIIIEQGSTGDKEFTANWTKVDNGAAGSNSDKNDSSSKTGDDANILGLLALMALAAAGAGTVFVRRRQN